MLAHWTRYRLKGEIDRLLETAYRRTGTVLRQLPLTPLLLGSERSSPIPFLVCGGKHAACTTCNTLCASVCVRASGYDWTRTVVVYRTPNNMRLTDPEQKCIHTVWDTRHVSLVLSTGKLPSFELLDCACLFSRCLDASAFHRRSLCYRRGQEL